MKRRRFLMITFLSRHLSFVKFSRNGSSASLFLFFSHLFTSSFPLSPRLSLLHFSHNSYDSTVQPPPPYPPSPSSHHRCSSRVIISRSPEDSPGKISSTDSLICHLLGVSAPHPRPPLASFGLLFFLSPALSPFLFTACLHRFLSPSPHLPPTSALC